MSIATGQRARRSVIYNRRVIRFLDRFCFGFIGAFLALGLMAATQDHWAVAVVWFVAALALWWINAFVVYMHKVQLDEAEQMAERVEHWPPPKS